MWQSIFHNMNKKYKLFIFDFDGTLGDTKECVVAAFQGALTANNFKKTSREKIIRLMGISLKDVFRELVSEELSDEMYEKLVADYRNLYRTFLTKKTLIFPGVKATLERMKDKGVMCSIVTSKKTEFAKLSCEHLGIYSYFDLLIGDDMVQNKKPHPEMLETTLEKLHVNKDDAVMIGDSTYDIEMGNAIGMDTIAVTWGAHSEKELLSTRPLHIINSFVELEKFI